MEKNVEKRSFQTVVADYLDQFPDDFEKKEVADFLRANTLGIGPWRMWHFPYAFPADYRTNEIQVHLSDGRDKYVMYMGKKLFFPSAMSDDAIRENYLSLLVEQDQRSPHCYSAKPKFIPEYGEVVADMGAAEGIWALSVIERCKKAYLFECDERWIDALRLTFAPWREKVEIVNKFIGDADDVDHVTLDAYFADKEIDCIKADIEGAEIPMLAGGAKTLSDKVSKVLLCAYHNQGDEEAIRGYLTTYGFKGIETTNRYLLFTYCGTAILPPYVRRALVLGCKKRTLEKLRELHSVNEPTGSGAGALEDFTVDDSDWVDALHDRHFLFEPLAKALERAGIKDRTIVLGWCDFSGLYEDIERAEGKIAYPPSTHQELLAMYHGIAENTSQYVLEIFACETGTEKSVGKFVKITDGLRDTTGQPASYDATIHFVGGSEIFGIGADDGHTLPSCVQGLLNGKATSYRVLNHGVKDADRYETALAFIESIREDDSSRNDLVILSVRPGLHQVKSKKKISDYIRTSMEQMGLRYLDLAQILRKGQDKNRIYATGECLNHRGYQFLASVLYFEYLKGYAEKTEKEAR